MGVWEGQLWHYGKHTIPEWCEYYKLPRLKDHPMPLDVAEQLATYELQDVLEFNMIFDIVEHLGWAVYYYEAHPVLRTLDVRQRGALYHLWTQTGRGAIDWQLGYML